MFDDRRAIVTTAHAGGEVVGRWPTVVLVSADPALNPVLRAASAPTLDDLLAASGPIAAVIDMGGEPTAITRGAAQLVIDGTATDAMTPHPIGDATTIRMSLYGQGDDTAIPGLDLRSGIVPGAGITIAREVAEPTPSFEVVDLRSGGAEARRPLPRRQPAPASPRPPQRPEFVGGEAASRPDTSAEPDTGDRSEPDPEVDQVMGIRCSRGHFNNPLTAYCQACGISMVHLTHQLVPGPRPTLGFVVFNDGATYALDRSYLLGRSPTVTADDGVVSTLVVADAEGSVSARHARLELVDWSVTLRDLGSTNGTYVWNVANHQWDRIGDQPTTLSPGAIVAVGRTTFVFESAVRKR